MIPFVNLANPLPTTPGTGLTAGQEAALVTATRRQPVASIAALKALTPSAGDAVNVLGYYAAGDRGGGTFYYDSAASAAGNGGTVIAPTAGSGRWIRAHYGELSVKCFGAKGDGVTNDTAAFAAAIAAIDYIIIPSGTYLVDNITIDRNINIRGTGRKTTKIVVQSYTTYQTIKCGVLCRGAASSPSLTDLASLSGVDIEITSAEAGQVGLLITRKLNVSDTYIHGAPGDGVYFRSVAPSSEAPYFCRFDSVWMKHNGGNGCTITENCNGQIFYNCQWSSNSGHGLHQLITGNGQVAAVYSTILIGGQAAYNDLHGIYFQNGSNNEIYGTYAELNSDVDGGQPKTGAYKNVQLGANITRSRMFLGEQGTDIDIELTIGLNTVIDNFVAIGGKVLTPSNSIDVGVENVGSGKAVVFRGAANCVHKIAFRETTADRVRFQYDGATNNVTFDAWTTGNAWSTVMTITRDATVSFFGATPQGKQTVSGSRGGNEALASLLTALSNLGLITDSSS